MKKELENVVELASKAAQTAQAQRRARAIALEAAASGSPSVRVRRLLDEHKLAEGAADAARLAYTEAIKIRQSWRWRRKGTMDRLRELVAGPVRDEQDLLAWLPKAALLAAARGGDPGPIETWPDRVKDARCDDLTELVHQRLIELVWDVENADGEDLADAVLDAQEWHLWAQRDDVPADAKSVIAEMIYVVRYARDGIAYREALEDWQTTWQVAESRLIFLVLVPSTAQDWEENAHSVDRFAEAEQYDEYGWPKLS